MPPLTKELGLTPTSPFWVIYCGARGRAARVPLCPLYIFYRQPPSPAQKWMKVPRILPTRSPPVSPAALPPLTPRYIDMISLCLFSVAFINPLYLLLSAFILPLPFCIDLFLSQLVSPSVYFLHFALYSLLFPFPSL